MRTMTRDEVRAFDRRAIEELNVPGIVLMENAGRQIADVAEQRLHASGGRRALIVAGRGNNGGDGFVVARHLLVRGFEPRVLLLANADQLKGDARTNFLALAPLGVAVTCLPDAEPDALHERIAGGPGEADLAVDALLGTGISGDVRQPYRAAIEAINAAQAEVLAIDIPSGLDADTGRPLGVAVRAATTVTMVAMKQGFAAEGSADYTGRVVVADIGIPGP